MKKKISFIYFIRIKYYINDKVGQPKKQLGDLYIMNRKFKQRRSIVTLLSTKLTIRSYLNSMNTIKSIAYGIENTGSGLGQTQKCGWVKLINGISNLPGSPTAIHI